MTNYILYQALYVIYKYIYLLSMYLFIFLYTETSENWSEPQLVNEIAEQATVQCSRRNEDTSVALGKRPSTHSSTA